MNKQAKEAKGQTYGVVDAQSATELMLRFQRIMSDFWTRQAAGLDYGDVDCQSPLGDAFIELSAKMLGDPARLMKNNLALWSDQMNLWTAAANAVSGGEDLDRVRPAPGDRRFTDPAWRENDVFNFIKQSYLLTSNWIASTIADVDGLDDETARKVNFYSRHFVNALSPSNFIATNPEVIRETIESGGENLVNGIENLLDDLEKNDGRLRISMSDENAFKLGETIASTPGKVIYRNDLVELIQYAPSTEKVFKSPLFIVTPWINKYYIVDLRPENSLVRWAVGQGHTVFVTSWVNPDVELAGKTFDDYMRAGILECLDAIAGASGEKHVNAVGYCIGGTLLAATLAYMAAKNDRRIKSATFLSAMVDFSDPGDLGVFIDRRQLEKLDRKMFARGYLDGAEMASTFNMMRENDLIWSFVVNNYLLGRAPLPFDVLYWNSDSTRMPAAMHSFYLRRMYLENRLVEPGGLELLGEAIDLRKIDLPVYMLSTRDDHIAPWRSTYGATSIYGGPIRFVLAGSGHIAGIINPPQKNKYCYWTNPKLPKNPQSWLKSARRNDGSWWPDWAKWLRKQAGRKNVEARRPGDGGLAALEDAPGSYVRVRSA